METTDLATYIPNSKQLDDLSLDVPSANVGELTPFERIVARMKGTGRIVGDIVSPDLEPWDCEVE